MPERRRRSAYRGKIEDDSDSKPTSPKPSQSEDQNSDVGSGMKRPRSSAFNTTKGILKNADKDVATEDHARKSRRTITGTANVDTQKQKTDQQARSAKDRQTLALVGGREPNNQFAAGSSKVQEIPEERKSSKHTSRSSSHGQSSKNLSERPVSHKDSREEKRPENVDGASNQEKRKKTDTFPPSAIATDVLQAATKPTGNGKQRATSSSSHMQIPAPETAPLAPIRFHDQIPGDLPEPKRLQKLLELAIEAEQDEISRSHTGKDRWISQAFDAICESFIIDIETMTIDRMKKRHAAASAADGIARPAQTAYARGEEEPPRPNPINDTRTAQELALRRTLELFQQEEREWERLAAAAAAGASSSAAAAAAAGLAPLPPPGAGGTLPAGHPLLQELSIADRALLAGGGGGGGSGAGVDLQELMGWAKGLVEGGLGGARAAVLAVEDRAGRAEETHRRLVGTLRRRALGSLNVNDPKRILRSVTGPA